MKKLIFATLLINSIFCFAQHERSRKFQVNAGVEYRITPFNFKGDREGAFLSSRNINFNRDLQLGGLSINIGLDWFFLKNTSFGIVQTFRYDQLYYPFNHNIKNDIYSNNKPLYALILDTELILKHYFPLRNNDKIFVNIGYGIMNQNTDYSTQYYNAQTDITTISQDWFRFDAYKIGMGYHYKKLEIGAGLYIIDNPSNITSTNETSIGMPYLKINYNIATF